MAPTLFVGEILAVIIAFVVMTVTEVAPNSCRATCGSIRSANGDVISLLPVPAKNVMRMNAGSATFVCLLPGADAISASPTQISLTPTTLPSPTKPKNLSSTKTTQSSQTTTSISTLSTPLSTPTTSTPAPLLTMSTFTSTPATLTSLTKTTQPTPSTNPSALSSIASSPTTASTAIATPTTPTKSCTESWSYYEGWCYGYFRDPVNFGSALSTCRTIAGLEADLVSIHSDAENAFVYDLWVSLEEYIGELLWIGYHQPTNGALEPFVWTDGTPDDYASWEPTQPDDNGGNENCASFWRRNPSDDAAKPWNDVPCDIVTAPFVCKAAI